MKYKHFPAPFFNHFIQPCPPTIAKLKSLYGVFRGQLSHENGPIPLWFGPHLITSKAPKLYALPRARIMTNMIR